MNDLIDRQAAIDAIKDFKQGAEEWRDEQEECSDIWHRADSAVASALEIGLRIKKLPSAQPERKTGKWIYEDEAYPGGNPYGRYKCDQCGEYVPHKTNFCPRCGAKMEETDEDQNH